jgi:hypothetical protein
MIRIDLRPLSIEPDHISACILISQLLTEICEKCIALWMEDPNHRAWREAIDADTDWQERQEGLLAAFASAAGSELLQAPQALLKPLADDQVTHHAFRLCQPLK